MVIGLQMLIFVIECQADLIRDAIVSIRKQNLRSVEPKVEAQEKWKADLNEMIKYTLFQHTGEAPPRKENPQSTCCREADPYSRFLVEHVQCSRQEGGEPELCPGYSYL
jgi:hypothetical protein